MVEETKISKLEKYNLKVKKLLGYGGQAKVYQVKNKEGKDVAMKMLNIPFAGMTSADKKALEREVETMKRLDHPLVLKIIENFVEDDTVYIITEYCPGGSFDKKL